MAIDLIIKLDRVDQEKYGNYDYFGVTPKELDRDTVALLGAKVGDFLEENTLEELSPNFCICFDCVLPDALDDDENEDSESEMIVLSRSYIDQIGYEIESGETYEVPQRKSDSVRKAIILDSLIRYCRLTGSDLSELIEDDFFFNEALQGSIRYLALNEDDTSLRIVKHFVKKIIGNELEQIVQDKVLLDAIVFDLCFRDIDLTLYTELEEGIGSYVLEHSRAIAEYLVRNKIQLPRNKQYVSNAFDIAEDNDSKDKSKLEEDLDDASDFLSIHFRMPKDDPRIVIFRDFITAIKERKHFSPALSELEIRSILDASFALKPRSKKQLLEDMEIILNHIQYHIENIAENFEIDLSGFLKVCIENYDADNISWLKTYLGSIDEFKDLSRRRKKDLLNQLGDFFSYHFESAILHLRAYTHYFENIEISDLLRMFELGNAKDAIGQKISGFDVAQEIFETINSSDDRVRRVVLELRKRFEFELSDQEIDRIVAETDPIKPEVIANMLSGIVMRHYKLSPELNCVKEFIKSILDSTQSPGGLSIEAIHAAISKLHNYAAISKLHNYTTKDAAENEFNISKHLAEILEAPPMLQEQLINMIRSVSDETDIDLNEAWEGVNSWDELYREAFNYMINFFTPVAEKDYKEKNGSTVGFNENPQLYTQRYIFKRFPHCVSLFPLSFELMNRTISFSSIFNATKIKNGELSDEEVFKIIQAEQNNQKFLATIKVCDIDYDPEMVKTYMLDERFHRMFELCKHCGNSDKDIVEKIKAEFGDQYICVPLSLNDQNYSEELIEMLCNPALPHGNDFLTMMNSEAFNPSDAETCEFTSIARMLLHLEYGSLLVSANFYRRTLEKLYEKLKQKLANNYEQRDGSFIMKIKDPNSDKLLEAKISLGNIKNNSSLIRKIFAKGVSNIAGSITDLFRIRVELPDEIEDEDVIERYSRLALGSVMSVFGTDFIEDTCKNSFKSGKTTNLSVGNFKAMKTVLKWITSNPNSPAHPHMMHIEVQICHKHPKDDEVYSNKQMAHSRANAFGVAPDRSFKNNLVGLIDIINHVSVNGRIFAPSEDVERVLKSRRDPYSWMANTVVTALLDPRNLNMVVNMMRKETFEQRGKLRILELINTLKTSELFNGKVDRRKIERLEKLYTFSGEEDNPDTFRVKRFEAQEDALRPMITSYSQQPDLSSVLVVLSAVCDPRNMYTLKRLINTDGPSVLRDFIGKIDNDISRLKHDKMSTNELWILFRISEQKVIIEALAEEYERTENDLNRTQTESFWRERYPYFNYQIASNTG